MTKPIFLFCTIFAIATVSLYACSSDPAPVDFGDLTKDPVTPIVSPGDLGDLTDLGDLVQPEGDNWYFTEAVAMNDDGIVIGSSNCDGRGTRHAFSWDPATGEMTSLFPDCELSATYDSPYYDDHYDIGYERADPRKPFIFSEAVDINKSGAIIGHVTTGAADTEKRAFLSVDRDSVPIDLPPYPYIVEVGDCSRLVIGSYSEAVDINDKGEIVLTLQDATGKHAYYWDGSSFITVWLNSPCLPITEWVRVVVPNYILLGRIVGAESEAVAINENRHVVVNSGGTAVFCDLNHDVVESLNFLPGATKTVAVDINDSQYVNNDDIPDPHIIGNSGSGNLVIGEDVSVRGFFWDGGAMYPVDDLGGGSSVVVDMNNSDQVAGNSTTADGSIHAFLWTLDEDERGVIRDLGTLGGRNSFATGINEAGQVVGYSETGDLYQEEGINPFTVWHAFLWDDGVMFDLGVHNDFYDYAFILPYPHSEAVGINENGEVCGNSITINAHYRGFYLSPVFP
jgi:probable HAF family extracellular repeat protein